MMFTIRSPLACLWEQFLFCPQVGRSRGAVNGRGRSKADRLDAHTSKSGKVFGLGPQPFVPAPQYMSVIAHFLLLSYLMAIHLENTIMNVSLGERWEKFVETTVQQGRYSSASEVVREGLRLVEEREAKLQALRDQLNVSIAAGGDVGDNALDAALDAESKRLVAEGF